MKYFILLSFLIFTNSLYANEHSEEYQKITTDRNIVYRHVPSCRKNKANLISGDNRELDVLRYEMYRKLANIGYLESLKQWFNNYATAETLQILREYTILIKVTIDEFGELYDITFITKKETEHILSENLMDEIVDILNLHKSSIPSVETNKNSRRWTTLSLGPNFWED